MTNTDYIIGEIKATAHLAHTLNRLAVQYRREGKILEYRLKRRSAIWYLNAAKDLKMLAIGDDP